MSTLVIDTRVPAPRKIGGGLDDPAPTTTIGRRRIHRPPPTDRTSPGPATRPSGVRPPPGHRTAAGAAQADTGAGHDDQTPPGHPEPAPPSTRSADPASTATPAGQAVDELAAVRDALGELVPVGGTVTTARLVQMVAVKLSSHGPHCAAAINPPRGSLTVDEARGRCRAVLDALDPVERHAVLALLTHDIRAATR